MVSPARSLLLLFYVACICIVFAVLSPKDITLSEDLALRVFTLEDFDLLKSKVAVDTEKENQLLAMQARQDSIEKALAQQEAALKQKNALDSVDNAKPDTAGSGRREKIEPVNTAVQKVEYPTNPLCMDLFFESLRKLSREDAFVRVLHFGDSQIEGDRISEYLRERLQDRFGGCGPGLLPPETRKGMRLSIQTNFSGNWRKYAYIDSKYKPKHSRLGPLQAYYTFVQPVEATTEPASQSSWVKYSDTDYGSELLRKTEVIKLIYAAPKEDLDLEVRTDGKILAQKSLDETTAFEILEIPVQDNYKSIKFDFKTEGEAEILGISIDCKSGVAVDNIPMRGSSGIEFSKIQKEHFGKQLKALDTKLIILQFGVNVVPSVTSSYKFYENLLFRQIKYLQAVCPDASILVVGLSDMARKNGLNYESYPNIEKIRDAQKNAAMRAGCAFWDLYTAMGGQNSMVSWVNAKPSLAGRDYTHFNARGARLVAQLLYDALIFEYEAYKKRVDNED